ncbi:MAG: BamA/TamA family outer membrane protein [Bacteroidota bacterium]|nr:BamA/TamA family outer membrane protein [Bacteroidota bacterium]
MYTHSVPQLVLLIAVLFTISACDILHAQDTDTLSSQVSAATRQGWRIIPVPSYSPETSFALTVGGVYYYSQHHGNATSRLNQIFGGIQYTLRNQFVVSVLPELYFHHENIRVFGQLEISRFPDFFYGIGNDLPESNREPFSIFRAAAIGSFWISLNGQGIRNGINAGVRFDIDYQAITERQPGGLLSREHTDTIPGRQGGLLAGIGLAINYDTRDIAVCARRGELVDIRLVPYSRLLGSTFEGWRATLSAHKYITFHQPENQDDNGFAHTLAILWFTDLTTGNIPFFRMGLLGQNVSGLAVARGYYGGRFRDKMISYAQAEYRFPLWWRFGGVIFAGTGNVAPSIEQFDFSTLKHSIGVGLRFAVVPEERIHLRIDLGYGLATQTLFPYVSFTEAF